MLPIPLLVFLLDKRAELESWDEVRCQAEADKVAEILWDEEAWDRYYSGEGATTHGFQYWL